MSTQPRTLQAADRFLATRTSDRPHSGDYGVLLSLPGIVAGAPGQGRTDASTPGRTGRPQAVLVGGVQEVLDDWLSCHRGNTAAAYRRDLNHYLSYCTNQGIAPLLARRVEISRYLRHLEETGRAPATIARRLTALRGFYRYAWDEDLIPEPATTRIRHRRPQPQARIRALTAPELARLLAAADAHSPRASALAWVLATTGLRISEACNARLEDLQPAPTGSDQDRPIDAATNGQPAGVAWLEVTCKGGLRRTVPLLPPALERVLEATRGRQAGPAFATRTGRPLDRHAAAQTLGLLADRTGITRFSPHVLRHTFVTLARAGGCALEDVQDAAGHADPATTRRYDRTIQGAKNHPGHQLISAISHARD